MSADTAEGLRDDVDEAYRTCLDTGLRIYSSAEILIKVNAVTAVIFLAVGGLFGVLVALTRWPAVHLLPAELFYLLLTAHGAAVLLFWVIFFEMAVLYFA
jgi:cytochrome c oxidase subunit 1